VNPCGVQPEDVAKPDIAKTDHLGVSVEHWRRNTCLHCKHWMPQDGGWCWWCTSCKRTIAHMQQMWKHPHGKCTIAQRFGGEDLWANITLLMPFYHIACMNKWQTVFTEQANLFDEVGLKPSAYVLGTAADARYVEKRMRVIGREKRIKRYETPTLQALWQWCQENPTGVCLYAHTKGVSRPDDPRRVAWRGLMNEYVIRDWRENLAKLQDHDAVGVNWLDRINSHFSGNFFMARADWINKLPSPMDHRYKERPQGDNGSWDRLGCELWLGCRKGVRVESLCARNAWIWGGRSVYGLLRAKLKDNASAYQYNLPSIPQLPAPLISIRRTPNIMRLANRPNSALKSRMT
jgi:hypothetical protein